MDSLDLISLNSKRISIKNKNKERKNYTKCINIIDIFIYFKFILFFLYLSYTKKYVQ